jgi:cell division protein FtsB
MPINSYNPHSRYRERAMARMTNAISMVLVIALSACVGFWMGKQYGVEQNISLEDQVESLTKERNVLQSNVTELRAEAQTANTRYEQIKAEYNAILPEGPMQDLTKLVRQQLDQGMAPERLSFVINSARPPTGCTDPETKRFVVSTPNYSGPDSSASVAEGGIIVKAKGVSASNKDGQPEAWYDPAQNVEISFISPEGTEVKKGALPIRHSVVHAGREYRFTIEEGAKSFAKVVFDSCAYP